MKVLIIRTGRQIVFTCDTRCVARVSIYCCLLYGRVVVSLAHSPFPFSILLGIMLDITHGKLDRRKWIKFRIYIFYEG